MPAAGLGRQLAVFPWLPLCFHSSAVLFTSRNPSARELRHSAHKCRAPCMGAAENRPPEEQDWASKEMQSLCFKQGPVEPVSAGATEGDAKATVARHAPKSLLAVTTLLYAMTIMLLYAMSAV